VHDRREDLDATKRELALPTEAYAGYGFSSEYPGLVETIERVRPTVLVGTTGVGGAFDEASLRAMAAGTARPIVLPLSNPTSASEAIPIDVLRWTDGRAIVATGSPFDAVEVDGTRREVGQANNVFIFPGIGLGAIAAESRCITDRMFLLAARILARAVSDDRLAGGAIYPPVGDLRAVTREIAVGVAREAVESGLAGIAPEDDIEATIDRAMWWPAYVPYLPARSVERRRGER
jgi:malic enzyme